MRSPPGGPPTEVELGRLGRLEEVPMVDRRYVEVRRSLYSHSLDSVRGPD